MKKLFLLLCLLSMLTSVGFAQESRQDASVSFLGTYQPTIRGNSAIQSSTLGKGALLGYRFMLTPSYAIQGNYQYSQFDMKYTGNYGPARIHTVLQGYSASFLRYFVYKNLNPFVMAGGGILTFKPVDDTGTTNNGVTSTKKISFLFGGGIAYELSPSWDVRVQYRAYLLKSIDFGLGQYNTNRYYLMQQPAIGFAYHF